MIKNTVEHSNIVCRFVNRAHSPSLISQGKIGQIVTLSLLKENHS